MNQNLPKRLIDALAREAAPADHPSADVLNAFAENSLVGDESRRVTDHLARCADCREIVFLASNAAEEPEEEHRQLVAAAAAPQFSPARLKAAERRRWIPRLAWSATIAAGLLLVAGTMVWWRTQSTPSQTQLASKAIENSPAQPAQSSQPVTPAESTVEVVASTPTVKSQAKTTRARSVPTKDLDVLGAGSNVGVAVAGGSAPAKTGTANASPESATITLGSAATTPAPAAPRINSFASSEAERAGAASAIGGPVVSPGLSLRSARSLHSAWRITSDGHLEHATPEGWSRVLANQAATFRVVSVVGDHVWVGGNNGVLFRSVDGGVNWERVAVTTSSGTEMGAIVSIRFDDSQHGTVTTSSGTGYATSDGGTTWTKP
jgi:hypothetical protein